MSWSFGLEDISEPRINSNAMIGQTNYDVIQDSGGAYSKLDMFDQSSSSGTASIACLIPGALSAKIIGIVISKEAPRHFPSKKDPSLERYLLSFTIRDSPTDFVNVTCWGGEQYITDLAQQFHISDIVEISHVSVQYKPTDGSDERFRPWTPSPFCINISEKRGSFRVVTEWYMSDMDNLLHIPTKPDNDYYTIGDVIANGQALNGQYINLLVVVKQVGVPKEITTKLGKKMLRCEVKLFDETSSSLDLVIWDEEMIHFAQSWMPKEHVLFAADVRVSHNDFRMCMVVTATSKTVITVNPDTPEAHKLYQYAQTVVTDGEQTMDISYRDGTAVNLDSVSDVYTIEQIGNKQMANTNPDASVYGVTFAYITTMDIDADIFRVIAVRCAKCQYRVDYNTGMCKNDNCAQGCLRDLDSKSTDSNVVFNLRLAISDHTGTLSGCRVAPEVVTKMLNCTPNQFQQLSEDQKTSLKWKFLLERYKIIFKIIPATYGRPELLVKIIACDRPDGQEVNKYYMDMLQVNKI